MPAIVGPSSVLCAAGRGPEQLWATIKSGISCIKNSHVMDRNFDPIQMALVPDEELAPLPQELESSVLPSSAKRMLRLAGPTLSSIIQSAGTEPATLYLGLPQPRADEMPWLDEFLMHLEKIDGVRLNHDTSRTFALGRAAAMSALEAALAVIDEDSNSTLLVGGVDTFLDMRRITMLDAEGRILGPRVMDGFIPGEGAAFFALKGPNSRFFDEGATNARILAATSVQDEAHRYSKAPGLGEGLANALEALRERLPEGTPPVATTFAGFNGENLEAKLWGVARLRHSDLFAPDMVMQHPADCFGDTGASMGAILMVLAAHALSNGDRANSGLVWAASDLATRGCALLSTQ
jgi:3-oxoacyl-[acyl-carrier-protein] synthase-1